MDNLTHSLVGLFLARAGFNRVTPRATAVMVVAANAPDFDVVSWLGGAALNLHWHRNITHSLIAVPVMALLTVAIVRYAGRQPLKWLAAWLIALVGVASHLLLDLTNIYGVRLQLPFSGQWSHMDITPVIDLGIWLILLLGVVAPALSRLVGSEIGEQHPDAGKAGWAFTTLLLLCGYDYARSMLHERAVAMVDAHSYNGLAPRRSAAFPTLNPLVWTGTAELSNAYVQGPVDLREGWHSTDFEAFYKPHRTPLIDAAINAPAISTFLEFVQYPLWGASNNTVTLYDLRFGTPQEPGFFATAHLDAQNHVTDSTLYIGGTKPR